MAEDVIDPRTYEDISKQWTEFLDQPGGRAAILSAGLALSQPRHWGQDSFGHLMSAIGTGGEAVGRVEEMNRKQQESDTKAQLAEAKMQVVGAQGQTAEVRQRYLESESERKKDRDKVLAMRDFGNLLRLEQETLDKPYHKAFEEWKKKQSDLTLTAAQKAALPAPTLPPRITPEDLIQRSSRARELAIGSGMDTSIPVRAGATSGGPTTAGISPERLQQAIDYVKANPTASDAIAIKQRLGL